MGITVRRFGLFFLLFSLFFSCDLFDPQKGDTPNQNNTTPINSNFTQGELFSTSDYQGLLSAASDAEPVGAVIYDEKTILDLTAPSVDSFTADGYFRISGSVTENSITGYLWLRVVKGTVSDWTVAQAEETSYWLTGDFDFNVWLRFGEGTYSIGILNIPAINTSNYDFIFGYSYSAPPAQSFTVVNQNSEDGRYLYPSAVVQSADSAILALAGAELYDGEDYPLHFHDFVVKHIAYDVAAYPYGEPANEELRQKQDALYALENGVAVCEGYTALYAAFLRARRIPVKYITGGNHAWNQMQIDGIWYYVDTTWDDPLIEQADGSYLSDYPEGQNLQDTYYLSQTLWENHTFEADQIGRQATAVTSAEFPGYPRGSY